MLSVVIPTYNEANRLPRTLREVLPFLRIRFPQHEIIIVDDNSPDGTASLASSCVDDPTDIRVLVQPSRLGKGAALRRGCMEARGDFILYMDADHATPIREVEPFLDDLRTSECGVVAGVRTYQENESKWRRILGLFAQLLAHLIVFEKAVVDSQCGFKLFTGTAARKLFPYCRVNGGMIDIELFALMHRYRVPCYFRPVHWANKSGTRINVILCMIRDPIDLLKIRLRRMFGAYDRPLDTLDQPWNTTQQVSQQQARHKPL